MNETSRSPKTGVSATPGRPRLAPSDRVLLLNPPADSMVLRDYYCSSEAKADYSYPPIDLVYLSGHLKSRYDVHVLDAAILGWSEETTLARLRELKPRAIVFLAAAPSFGNDVAFLERVARAHPDATIVGTGDVFRDLRAESFTKFPWLDATVVDFSTPDLLSYFQGSEPEPIPNMIYRSEEGLVEAPEQHGRGTFSMPAPRWDLFPLRDYRFPFARRHPCATVLTDFGCTFACTFCPISTLGFKLRPIPEVIDELRMLIDLGVREIHFRDQTFATNRKRTQELCRAMRPLRLTWSCFSRVDVVRPDVLAEMRQAGCHTVIFGIESASDDLMKKYKKNTTTDQVRSALNICRSQGLSTVGTFIIGLPGETRESTAQTIRYACSLPLDFASFNIATPRFGTTFRKEALRDGIIDADVIEIGDYGKPPVYRKHDMPNGEIVHLSREANRRFYLRPAYIFHRLLRTRSLTELRDQIRIGFSLMRNSLTADPS